MAKEKKEAPVSSEPQENSQAKTPKKPKITKIKVETNPSKIHAGHRQRMFNRMLINDLNGFSDHEILELLLFFAIPRKNVNHIAHAMVTHCGSFNAVIKNPPEYLMAFPGIGEKTAVFLSTIKPLLNRIEKSVKEPPVFVNSPEDIKNLTPKWEKTFVPGKPQYIAILLNRVRIFQGFRHFPGPRLPSVRQILKEISGNGAAMMILIEQDTDHDFTPHSPHWEDIAALASSLRMFSLEICDYCTLDTKTSRITSLRNTQLYQIFANTIQTPREYIPSWVYNTVLDGIDYKAAQIEVDLDDDE